MEQLWIINGQPWVVRFDFGAMNSETGEVPMRSRPFTVSVIADDIGLDATPEQVAVGHELLMDAQR